MPHPKILSFEAAIPATSSAIKMGGGQGECTTLTLSCYAGDQINDLAGLRGQQLRMIIGPADRMLAFAEIIDRAGVTTD